MGIKMFPEIMETILNALPKDGEKELSVLPMKKCLITKYDQCYDQTFYINRDLKIKTKDDIYIEIYIVDSCKNHIEFKTINNNISESQSHFGI